MSLSLKGIKVLVTAGPTFEPIDPVRFIGNRSSGKQGYAIAAELAKRGALVTLVSGPVHLAVPEGVQVVPIETAREMLEGCLNALPVHAAVCVAAVSDWTPVYRKQKIKKRSDGTVPDIQLKENPDILKTIAMHAKRPDLVVGFAAETENLLVHAREKLARKKCDWILANDVSQNVFGGDENHVYLISQSEEKEWARASKEDIARCLGDEITEFFKHHERSETK